MNQSSLTSSMPSEKSLYAQPDPQTYPASVESGVEPMRAPSKMLMVLRHLSFTGLPILLIVFLHSVGIPETDLVTYSSILLLWSLAWSLWSWKALGESLFSPYAVTLLAAYLYHCGQFWLLLFGMKVGSLGHVFSIERYSPGTLLETQILVLVALSGFHLGAILSSGRRQTPPEGAPASGYARTEWAARNVGLVLILIAIVPAFLVLHDKIGLRLQGNYGTAFDQDADVGLANWRFVIGGLLLPGALFLLAGSRRRPMGVLVSGICIAILLAGYLVIGRRSSALLPVVGFAWVFHTCIRPLPKTLLITGGLIIALVIAPLVGVLRLQNAGKLRSLDAVTQAYFSIDNPIVSFVDEGGMSVITVCDTLELVPRQRSFDYGRGYANAVIAPINFLTDIDFTGGYPDPSKWLVETRYPDRLEQKLWIGYSFIAEAYLEFGWFGAPIILGFFAMWLIKLTRWATAHFDHARIAMVGTFMVSLPLFTRGNTLQLGRPFLRYALLPYLLVVFVAYYNQHRIKEEAPIPLTSAR